MAGATKKEREVASVLLELIHAIPKFDHRNLARRFPAWNGTRKRSSPGSGGGRESTSTPNCPLLFSPSSSSGDDEADFLPPPPPYPPPRCSLKDGFQLGRKDGLFLDLSFSLVKDDFHSDAEDCSPAKKRLKICDGVSKGFQGRKDGIFLDLNRIPEAGFPSDYEDSEVEIVMEVRSWRSPPPGKKWKGEEPGI